MTRTNNALRNIAWGTFYKLSTILIPFINRTVMIYTLGMKYVGLGSLFSSVLQVLSFAELGIGSALVYSMYKPMAEADDKKVSALLNLYRKTYRIIGIIVFIFGMVLMPFIDKMIAADAPEDINLQLLFFIYLVNNVASYIIFAYKQSLFIAAQRLDVTSKLGVVMQVVSGLLQIVLLVLFENYYLYIIVLPIITILTNCLTALLAKKSFPQFQCYGDLNVNEKKVIKKKVEGMVSQKIGGIILSSVDTIVISSFLGLLPLALFQNYYYIITSLFGVLMVIMQSIIAGVGNSIVTDSVSKNYNDFKRFNFLYVWIIAWCTTCLMCLFDPFMQLWVGKDCTLGKGMVLLFSTYFFVHKWCDVLYVYQEACGIWWETRFIPLAAAIVNLVLNIVLVQYIGLPGILISTILAVLLIYDTGYAKVLFSTYFKNIERGLLQYWYRQILYLITVITVSSLTYFLCNIIVFDNLIIQLIINSIICILFPNVLFWLIWKNFSEYVYAKSIINSILAKVVK